MRSHPQRVRPQRRHQHAVVLGASMAGLVTAKALADHFEHVTIVERDRLPDSPSGRAGVPQGNHLHVLLPGGAQAIEQLFPGFADGLLAAGAVPVGAPEDVLWLNPAGWVQRFPSRHRLLSASRDLIEHQTRKLVRATDGISIIDGRAVQGLVPTPDGRGVSAVSLRPAETNAKAGRDGSETLAADLIVDATGRRSKLPDWLERLGYGRPAETRIDAKLSYATCTYRRGSGDHDWKAIFLQSDPRTSTRMGLMFPIEGDRWMVTLQGAGGDHPPLDDEGFTAFARSLRSPVIHEAIRGSTPLTPIVGFANTANRRRHYERLRRWPERLVAVGDSACAFNPVYGQGISVCSQTAVQLHRRLADRGVRSLDGFAPAMQREVAKAGRAAWMISTGDDLRLPTTEGARANAAMRFQHRYLDRVQAAATTDETVLAATMDAFFLLAKPETLFHPRIVVRSWRRRRERGGTEVSAPTPVTAIEAQ